MDTNIKEEEYIDEDYQEIEFSEPETDLITKVNSPINIILIGLNILVIIAIILVLILL